MGAFNRVGVLQNDGAGLQQGLEVGDNLRPAAGHRRDEFRGFALDGVGDGELDRRSTGFQFQRALRLAFGLELGLVLVMPADDQAPWRLGLDDLAGVADLTVAGTDPKVKALVYVAALQPDAGETTGQLAPPMPPVSNDFKPTKDGFVFLDPAKFAADFGADLPKAQAEFMAHSQMPVSGAAFNAKLTAAAWRDKPSYAIVATQDRALNPELARWMAKRAGSKVTVLKASHAVHISHPRAVARVIETAARAVK